MHYIQFPGLEPLMVSSAITYQSGNFLLPVREITLFFLQNKALFLQKGEIFE